MKMKWNFDLGKQEKTDKIIFRKKKTIENSHLLKNITLWLCTNHPYYKSATYIHYHNRKAKLLASILLSKTKQILTNRIPETSHDIFKKKPYFYFPVS
jgi:hypothetical protein